MPLCLACGGIYVCVVYVHTRVHWVSCSISLHFIPLAKSISLNLGQAVSQKTPHKPPASTSHSAELRQTQLFTPVLGSKLRPSGWCNKCSHPPCRAVPPAPLSAFYMGLGLKLRPAEGIQLSILPSPVFGSIILSHCHCSRNSPLLKTEVSSKAALSVCSAGMRPELGRRQAWEAPAGRDEPGLSGLALRPGRVVAQEV